MSSLKYELLVRLLDDLIPGDGVFPAPSAMNLAAVLLAHERFGATTLAIVGLLPSDFVSRSEAERIAAITQLEAEWAPDFESLMTGLYSLYYVHPAALSAVAQTSGYAARPPQPGGYRLPAFDPVVVAIPAARPPHYRAADRESAQ